MKKISNVTIIAVVTSVFALLAVAPTLSLYSFVNVNDGPTGFAIGIIFKLLWIVTPVLGYALFVGYCITAYYKKHNFVFWVCSFLYNICLLIIGFYVFFISFVNVISIFKESIFYGLCYLFAEILFTSWLVFVAFASLRYAKIALAAKSQKLP